jgi:hypothetical protein
MTRRADARRRWALAAAVAALVAFLPFVRGVLAGRVLYFRDLAVLFYPFRQFAAEGLRAGQLRYWDPYVHEGVPLLYPPMGYPLDILQAAWLDLRWISLLLALHVPLGAAAFTLLARRLGLSPVAAAGGGVIYALGGFYLSTINLYVYVQAAAWAPLVVLSLRSAAMPKSQGRALGLAALLTGIAWSTLGVEVVLQTIVIGLVLAVRLRRPTSLLRPMAALGLGAALAAPVVLVMRANMSAGERAHGFAADIVLNQSVHPFTLLQTMAANLYGDLARGPDRWWGSNFFDRGFPYILSLYLGATVVALAVTGGVIDRRRSRRLIVVALAALVIALGRWGGLELLLEILPPSLRVLRYPTKAFFAVHFCVALLAAIGLQALSRARGRRTLFVSALLLGMPLAAAPLAPMLLPDGGAWFVAHFFPPAVPALTRAQYFTELLADAAGGGGLALAAALIAALAWRGRLGPALVAPLVAAIAAADLLRAGAGLNPMASPAVVQASPVVVEAVQRLPGLQRVFTCRPEGSPSYWQERARRPQDHEALTLATWADTLTPHFNRPAHVRAALSDDLTSLIPLSRLLPRGVGCGTLPTLLPQLRAAGVSHVLSLDRLDGPGLREAADIAPPRLAPLHVYAYAVEEPLPLAFLAARDVEGAAGTVRMASERPGGARFEVDADRETDLVVLEGFFPGWHATVNAQEADVLAVGRHRAVRVPRGHSTVTMAYRPPGLGAGLGLGGAAAVLITFLWWRDRLRPYGAGAAGVPVAEPIAAKRTG